MEDMALLKIEALVEMQRRNGLSISESKVNNKARERNGEGKRSKVKIF